MNNYIVTSYMHGKEKTYKIMGKSALEVLRGFKMRGKNGGRINPVSVTSCFQKSPVESDRDNVHAQFNRAGSKGIYVKREEMIEEEADVRNDQAPVPENCTSAYQAAGFASLKSVYYSEEAV